MANWAASGRKPDVVSGFGPRRPDGSTLATSRTYASWTSPVARGLWRASSRPSAGDCAAPRRRAAAALRGPGVALVDGRQQAFDVGHYCRANPPAGGQRRRLIGPPVGQHDVRALRAGLGSSWGAAGPRSGRRRADTTAGGRRPPRRSPLQGFRPAKSEPVKSTLGRGLGRVGSHGPLVLLPRRDDPVLVAVEPQFRRVGVLRLVGGHRFGPGTRRPQDPAPVEQHHRIEPAARGAP